ncbi:MAG: hypothetical protein EZS28_014411 [Streblomastix strix]|uniref:Protein kinase domain-containing protein n=1 Tax=Streblomastix strix TaxID=222440 RepID=A0A5J4W5W7_9EUKA|nr:MAG: hypothetical protein EZS28_014411 [Streblomastix strix]
MPKIEGGQSVLSLCLSNIGQQQLDGKEQGQEIELVMGIESVPISVSKCRSKGSNIDIQLFRADQALSVVRHLTAFLVDVKDRIFEYIDGQSICGYQLNNKEQLGKGISGNESEFIRETLILQIIGKGHQESDIVTPPRIIGTIPQQRIIITSPCGMNLRDIRIGKISGSDIKDFEISEQDMIGVIEALEQAHINGWYHRDVSPSNFVIVNNNEIGSKQTSDMKRLSVIEQGNAVE